MDKITKNTLFFIFLLFAFLTVGFGQPAIEWERSYGGSGDDNAEAIQQTIEGGYIIAGTTRSSDGDITFTNGGADYWVIKLNRNGDLEWKKNYGGSRIESLASIQQTNDEGYIVAGYTFSTDGDVSNNNGETDYWVVKLDNNGNLEWEKNYGGSSYDNLNSIKQTIDEGYIIAGSSFSSDGDVGANYGNGANDYWIIKLNNKGDLEWEKNYGGDGGERANSIQQTSDGGYVIAGESRSSNGDVNNNNGDWDYWIIKLGNNGNLEWEKNYGGSKSENAFSIQQTSDGGYIVTGDTFSSDGDVSENKGKSDYWIVKLNDKGDLEWERTYGGSGFEKSSSIQQTSDEGYIVAGSAESIDGDISNNKGITNYWIIKLDNSGNLTWEKTYGGSYIDVPSSIQQTNDKGYIMAGSSRSSDGDLTGNYGERDYWIVKLVPNCQTIDSLALVDLYNSTNGPNWSSMKWDLTQPISEWDGLTLNENGCVKILELQNNNLVGSLPASIGNLSQLENLALWDNQITGSIPTSIGNLTNLKYFSIYNNQLTGGIPAEMGELNNLIWLSLAGNTNLGGAIPSALGNLTNLEGCYLSGCNLSGTIPDNLQNLTSLKEFSVASNLNLTGTIPSWISNFTQLEKLFLFGNSFTGTIPASLADLPNLTHFYLHENNLSGCFPNAFSKFCSWTNQGGDIDNAGYNFKVNSALPWSGDLTDFCSGTSQIGATCDDGNSNTLSSLIDENCDCVEEVVEETCRSRDSLALVALYNATDGVNWRNTWDLNQPMDDWNGVSLNEEGCVTYLDLSSNDLIGNIPPELGNLVNLTSLYFDSNELTGNIPSELGNLVNLRELSLIFNQLSGNIPSELGNLVNLEELVLHGNQLTGDIPPELGNLSNLYALAISKNQLTGSIPPELGNLRLTGLFLSNNNLSGCFPPELAVFCELQPNGDSGSGDGYNFTNNSELPWNGDMERWCNNEPQIGAPCDDGNPDTDNDKITEGCECKGEVIETCRSRDSLVLVAFYNATSGVDWNNNENWLSNEPIDKWFGVEINSDGCVNKISLSNNQLTGSIPSELGNLNELIKLGIEGNQISNSIPIELGSLSSLKILQLGSNQLTGNIPSELGALSNLEELSLFFNNLTGSIPIELCNLSNLKELRLFGNELTGSIPMEFSKLNNLENLSISGNNLTGFIPPELGNLINLEEIGLYYNKLSGIIPPELGNLINLRNLRLYNNNITGTIPPELGNLSNLQDLSLFTNNLTGNIPKELGNLKILRQINIAENQITGSIPEELGNLIKLKKLVLNNNQLSGRLPSSLSKLTILEGLYINDNEITGCIPEELTIFCNLKLNTSNNHEVGFNLTNNLGLPWNGDMERWCNGESQIGAPCNDENPNTENDKITENCACKGEVVETCRSRDSLVLVAFYNATGGADWTNNENWLSNEPIDKWFGVEINSDGCVNKIRLSRNQLTGSIPSELGNMSNLSNLSLYGNQLTGSVPPELGSLSKLSRLYLNSNQLTGNIPKEIGNLVNLTELALSDNQLDGCYPDDLLQYCNLTQQKYRGDGLLIGNGYNLTNNPGLPWQGDMERWCNDEPQIGAPCDDQNPDTGNDKITEDCECQGTSCQPQTIEIQEQICQRQIYTFGDKTLTESGNYEAIFQSIAGCDSTVLLNLQLLTPNTEQLETVRICEGESYPFGNQNLSIEDIYYDTIRTTKGCDSIIQELLLEVTAAAFVEAQTDTFIFDNPPDEIELGILENDDYAEAASVTITILTQPNSGNIAPENITTDKIGWTLPDELPDADFFTYQVCVEQEGCETACSTAEVYLFFERDCKAAAIASIPRAFAPNSDNRENKIFHPLLAFREAGCVVKEAEISLTIHNRWGEVVFESKGDLPWNGKRQKGGKPLPPNAYYYIFQYGKSKKEAVKGAVNLVKLE